MLRFCLIFLLFCGCSSYEKDDYQKTVRIRVDLNNYVSSCFESEIGVFNNLPAKIKDSLDNYFETYIGGDAYKYLSFYNCGVVSSRLLLEPDSSDVFAAIYGMVNQVCDSSKNYPIYNIFFHYNLEHLGIEETLICLVLDNDGVVLSEPKYPIVHPKVADSLLSIDSFHRALMRFNVESDVSIDLSRSNMDSLLYWSAVESDGKSYGYGSENGCIPQYVLRLRMNAMTGACYDSYPKIIY
jgi:hypothetical protein